MRLNRTAWLVIGVGIFVVAAVVLFMFYRGQADKQQEAKDELGLVQDSVTILFAQKRALDDELAQKENELAQWNDTIGQLEDQLAQAVIELEQTQAGFPTSLESIEYDEALFAFAHDSNLGLTILTASEMEDTSIEDITYKTASFKMEVRGEVADILDFINTIVNDDDFKTAILEPVIITVPEPLTDEQKESIEEDKRIELTAEAVAQITTEEMAEFMLEAIVELTGQEIEALMVREIAETIRIKIAVSLEEDYVLLLSGDLAELIEQHIAESIVSEIVRPLAEEIAALIVAGGEEGYNEEDLEELLGPDIAGLLGEEIAGALPGGIESLLNEYIADIVENKMLDSVSSQIIEEVVVEYVAQQVEEMEMPSATIELVIYTYQGEGE